MIAFPPNFDIQYDVMLADFTTIRIGGPADYLVEVKDQNIFVQLYRFCRENKIPFLAIGDGTNIFFPESGYRGLVAVMRFDKISTISGNSVVAEAGATLEQLNEVCIENRLTGFEFTSGIPGTVGGAIYGNAGAYGNMVGNLLVRAKILTLDGKIEYVEPDYFQFAYRTSRLKQEPAFILQAEFQLAKGDRDKIRATCQEIIDIRTEKLPPQDTPTAGSWFKNIETPGKRRTAAAMYLDKIGSKQIAVRDAAVHPKHANIFYNKGRATAQDMLELEAILKKRVFDELGIELHREVMYID